MSDNTTVETSNKDDSRRWRETAYLHAKNWPEAIPWDGPKTEYGVYPWGEPSHDQYGIDNYPWSHPDAASISYEHMGDVCPMCGVPLRMDQIVITKTGAKGELIEVSKSEDPEPSYHPHCYDERQEKLQEKQMRTISEFR